MMPLYDCIKDYDLVNETDCCKSKKVQTNCPNCGAPINPNLDKCEYCGTYYLNTSYVNHLIGKLTYAKIQSDTVILSAKLKEELDKYNKVKRTEASIKNLKKLYKESRR